MKQNLALNVVSARFAILLFLFSVTAGFAQTGQGRITGYVHDDKDAAIVGARVVIVSSLTGERRETVTTSEGTFSFPLLPPSTYDVTASSEGFRTEKHTGIQLTAEAILNVDMSLHVGQVSQSVDVKADAELVTTQGAAIGETIGEEAITELPLNGRNPAALINITPGAIDTVNTSNAGFSETYVNFPAETASSVGGMRQGNVYYTLDGANAMDSWGGLATPMPNPDATQEFKVTSNNPDAESGFSAGGTVSIVTKSGTNQWHGDGFEFLRNGEFNSQGWFDTQKDELHRNQFGGSLGGPIKKDKLFVFMNYQGTVNHQTVNGGQVPVPNTMALAGNFQFLCQNGFATSGPTTGICNDRSPSSGAPAGTICNPGVAPSANCTIQDQLYIDQAATQNDNGTNAYLNNMIPTSMFNPVALNVEALFPQTSNPSGLVSTAGLLNVFNYEEGTAKVDYLPNASNRISFRTFIDNYDNPATGTNIIEETRAWPTQFQSHAVTWTWTVRPNLLNNFVFGYSRNNSDSTSGYTTNITKLGATGVATDPQYPTSLGLILDNWANCLCENFNGFNRHTINLTDSVTWTKGKHLITAGVDVLYQNQYGGTDWGAVPIINIDGSQTGNWMSDFLLGDVQSFQQSGGGFTQEYQTYYSAYATDTIRLRPNLTVNAGVRWEPFIARTSSEDKEGVWRPGQQSTRFPNAPLGEVYPGDSGIPAGGVPNRYDIFSPRLGIAWQPKLMPHMSVRAGFGMFAAPADGTLDPGTDDQPFTPIVTVTADTPSQGVNLISLTNPWASFTPTGGTSPFPPFATPSWNPPKNAAFQPTAFFGSFAPNYTSGKNESWNLSLERQFGQTMVAKVAYVGSHAYDLPIIDDENAGQFFCAPVGPNCTQAQFNMNGTRPISYVQELAIAEPAAVSSYDGLLLSFDKKFSRSLLFSVNYTWSKTLDELSASHFDGNDSFTDPYDVRHDYGISDLNFPRLFNMYWVYISPGLRAMNPIARGFLATWQLSGIWHMQSGRPFSIQGGDGNDNSFSLESGDRADLVPGQTTGVNLGKGNITAQGWIPYITNVGAFTENAIGTFGNSGRNILAGPGINNWDLAGSKNFQITERFRLQIRADAFNAFNRTQFGLPDTYPNDAATGEFGTINSIQNAPRVIQFAGKFFF